MLQRSYRLWQVDRETLVKLVTQRGDLSEEQVIPFHFKVDTNRQQAAMLGAFLQGSMSAFCVDKCVVLR